MNHIFLIFGYGAPKNISKDDNYNIYLKTVFNKIYSLTVKHKINRPIIILNGGHTDCYKPYRRTEAGEMLKFFKNLIEKPALKQIIKNWIWLCEKKSISTLENLLYSQEIFSKKKKKMKANLYIFCEQTRKRKVEILSKKIFSKKYNLKVIPIDFDTSANRYLDAKFIKRKEEQDIKHALWALKSSANLKKHHQFFQKKLKIFRKTKQSRHVKTIEDWWKFKLKELEK